MQPYSDEGGRVKFCDINSFKLERWWAEKCCICVSLIVFLGMSLKGACCINNWVRAKYQGRCSFGQEKISDIMKRTCNLKCSESHFDVQEL